MSATVTLNFEIHNDQALKFANGSSSDASVASVDKHGNISVSRGGQASLNFAVSDRAGCKQTWYITNLDLKDKDTGKWEGQGSKAALTSAEAGCYTCNGSSVSASTGCLAFPYASALTRVCLGDANNAICTVNYRLSVSDGDTAARSSRTLDFDPTVADKGSMN